MGGAGMGSFRRGEGGGVYKFLSMSVDVFFPENIDDPNEELKK